MYFGRRMSTRTYIFLLCPTVIIIELDLQQSNPFPFFSFPTVEFIAIY